MPSAFNFLSSGGRLSNTQVQALLPFVGDILNTIPIIMADRAMKIRDAIFNPPPTQIRATFGASSEGKAMVARGGAAVIAAKERRKGAERFGEGGGGGRGGGGGGFKPGFGASGRPAGSGFGSGALAGGITSGSPTAAASARAGGLTGNTGTGLDPAGAEFSSSGVGAAFERYLTGG